VKVPGVSTVPPRIVLAQTSTTVDITVNQVKAVVLVIHHHQFKEKHNCFLNVYTVENLVDCSHGIAMNNDATSNVASSQDMYGHLMDCISLPIQGRNI
jgi:predicted RNase H-related nuclease YkuK (DUF458 family)